MCTMVSNLVHFPTWKRSIFVLYNIKKMLMTFCRGNSPLHHAVDAHYCSTWSLFWRAPLCFHWILCACSGYEGCFSCTRIEPSCFKPDEKWIRNSVMLVKYSTRDPLYYSSLWTFSMLIFCWNKQELKDDQFPVIMYSFITQLLPSEALYKQMYHRRLF